MSYSQRRGYESEIRFRCKQCKELNVQTIPVPETNWNGDNADERFTQDEEGAVCSTCGADYLLFVQNVDGSIFVSIDGHRDIEVKASNAHMVGDWEGYYEDLDLPPDPAENFGRTLVDVRELLKLAKTQFYTDTINRMAFIQQFAGLEAYLSDTLITMVLERPSAMSRAVKGIKGLNNMAVTLPEIAADPDIVKRKVAGYLRDLLYHNFATIDAIWQVVTGNSIFPDKDVESRMFKAKDIRHDCVHRNGKNKEGEVRTEVNDSFPVQVDADMLAMMTHIEATLLNRF